MSFAGNGEESKWESFTLTMRSPLLPHRVGIDRPIPGIRHPITDPKVTFGALKKALGRIRVQRER